MKSQSEVAGKRRFRAFLTTLIALLMVVSAYANVAFAETADAVICQVNITVDGSTQVYEVNAATISEALSENGIVLDENDYTEPALDTAPAQGMNIDVYRVDVVTEKKREKIGFSTTKKQDKTLEKGKKKTVKKGQKGAKEVTYEVTYVNGEAESKETVSEVVVKEAVNEIVKVGTKKSDEVKSNGVKSKNGYTVGQKITGRYTHYCACARCNGNSRGITSSGKKIKNGMKNPHYIACNWLPLGTVIKVDGVNYTVVDRGGSGLSRKGRIDIFTPEGHSACFKYGTGSCTIEIVRLGW